ncbi:hypothetical protein GCM10009122_57510 [Fulvivirga kasyanovii]|uniref:hypothetical protein n=1 Tax=Fulvivirga kasyanovii TaxID=396812 RepID=UPI0031DB9BD7
MKLKIFFVIYAFVTNICPVTFCQTGEASIRNKVLEDIVKESSDTNSKLEKKIGELDQKIKDIDDALLSSKSEEETISKLRERIKILEEKEQAQRNQELSIYTANYQTAVINLVSMEKEIRPLELFAASRDFYDELNEVSNPMSYDGYKDWFTIFKKFVNEKKDKDATLEVTSKILNTVGDFTGSIGITGALSECLFDSIGKFIESLGSRDKKLRKQSVEMFNLTMILSQYANDKNLIESEWSTIETELSELKEVQKKNIAETLKSLSIDKNDFDQKFLQETNAIKSLNYLNKIKDLAKGKVESERKNNIDSWKDNIYLDMQTVQSLKIRFGQNTTHIFSNLKKYQDLVNKYKKDTSIGVKVISLEGKLSRLEKAFDQTFNPQKYISDASRMYKIY